MTRFNFHIDLHLAGEWVDITDDVYQRDSIEISRGRPDESSRADPAQCGLTVNNRSGKYSPRNPTSPLFGKIARNTPLRVGVGVPSDGVADFVDTPDADIATDRSHAAPSVTARTAGSTLICAWINALAGDYTVPASMTADLELDGSHSTMVTATETLTAAGATGTRTATFAVGDVHGHAHASLAISGETAAPVVEEFLADESDTDTITFVTGTDVQVGWWLVGIQAYHFDPNDELPFIPAGTAGDWRLLADSLVANDKGPHLRAWARRVDVAGAQKVVFPTADGFANNHARLYVLSGVAWSSIRFVGEVAAWPPQWDLSEADVWVPVQAAGIMRRLGQRAKPLRSAIYRETMSPGKRAPRAYWPCEDGEGARFIASALDDGTPMRVISVEAADLASFAGFAGSEPLPVLNTARFFGDVPVYTVTGKTQARWLLRVDPAGATNLQQIVTLYTDTTLRWEVLYDTTGDISVRVYGPNADNDIVLLQDSGAVNFNIDGLLVRMALEIHQEGANIRYALGTIEPGAKSGLSTGDQFVNGRTMGRVQRLAVGEGKNLGNAAFGHLSVHDEVTAIFDLSGALNGWIGEVAGRRFARLCREEGVPASVAGDPDDTITMGAQRPDTLLNLLGECAGADGGILHETRDILGLTYRPRLTLYNQGQP